MEKDSLFAVRLLAPGEVDTALGLVWRVFLEFEAPDYIDEGVREFKAFIEPAQIRQKMLENQFRLWGGFDGGALVGVLGARPPCHISLLFVEKSHHRRGVARALLAAMLQGCRAQGGLFGDGDADVCGDLRITVNSSPYAAPVYRRLGFADTGAEQTVNGIRFFPMAREVGAAAILAACGNDCGVCPRYTAKTDAALRTTAEVWCEVGWRDHVVENAQIACNGCTPANNCRYRIARCAAEKGVQTCGECAAYPCPAVEEMFQKTAGYAAHCAQVLDGETYAVLHRAFFEKRENLDKIHSIVYPAGRGQSGR